MGKIVAGVSLLLLSLGIATADEFMGSITKVDGKKITAKVFKFDKDAFKNFKKGDFKKGDKGEEKGDKSEDKGEKGDKGDKKGEDKGDKGDKKGDKKGAFKAEEKTFTIASDCKFVKRGKWDPETKKPGESTTIEDGLKNKLFTDATEESPLKGVRITTNDKGEVTQIQVGGGRGFGFGGFGDKKKKKNNDTSAD